MHAYLPSSVRRTLPSIALVLMVVLVGIAWLISVRGAGTRPPEAIVHMSWAWNYADLTELREAADAVVEGRVVSVATAEDKSAAGLAASLVTMRVDRPLKGESGATIVVKQTGGYLGGVYQRVDDDPLMAVGDHVLLYLAYVDSGPYDGVYFVLGGPQGRLAVNANGTLTPFGDIKLGVDDTLKAIEASSE